MACGVKLKYEQVKEFFEAENCELLSTEYKNARTKLKYKCSCGNIAEIVYDSFKQGNRCRKCGIKRSKVKLKLSQEYVEKYFLEQGCKLIDAYVNSRTPMSYICCCGNESKINWNNFKSKNRRCKECGYKKISGENHYDWKPDREAHTADYMFRQRCYKLLKMVLNVTGRVKNEKSAKLLGYDYKQLQEHITNHPNWEHVKDGKWHVDHIFPIKAFLDFGISDLKIINALDNLRPLDVASNLSKNAKYDRFQFEIYLQSKGIIYNQDQ